MEKSGKKCRDIRFRSDKNECVLCVHSRAAREYARYLEEDEQVERYEVCVPLEPEQYQYVNPIDIRREYFSVSWTSDFMIHYADGTKGIREIVTEDMLFKRANIEKLEFSRRYWAVSDMKSWKIVIMKEGV